MAAKAKPTITLVGCEEDADLRYVGWNKAFLSDHTLKSGEGILYVNRAQDRFRIVANLSGKAVLLLPPVDKEARLSVHLEVSRYLRRLCSLSGALSEDLLDLYVESATERFKRRQAAAKRIKRGKK
jgi:hypothetical protein